MAQQQESGFKDLLVSIMTKRWYITALVLGGFMLIIAGMFAAIGLGTRMAGEWKELLLLLLGAFIGSYGKIISKFSNSCITLVAKPSSDFISIVIMV